MNKYGIREIVRNPALLKIAPDEVFIIEDKRTQTMMGLYLGPNKAHEFLRAEEKEKMVASAVKIKENSKSVSSTVSHTSLFGEL